MLRVSCWPASSGTVLGQSCFYVAAHFIRGIRRVPRVADYPDHELTGGSGCRRHQGGAGAGRAQAHGYAGTSSFLLLVCLRERYQVV